MATVSSKRKLFYLNVAYFDARGVERQKQEIASFLVEHNIDVMLLQETFLKPRMPDPEISDYNIIRNDRLSRPKGGTLIYYRSCLRVVPLKHPQLDSLEVSACKVVLSGHQSIVLVSVLLPLSKDVMQSDIRTLLELGPSVILAGNLNSQHSSWNPSGNNCNGDILFRLSSKFSFDIFAPTQPTRCFKNRAQPVVNDIALLKNVTLTVESIETVSGMNSDHFPVLLKLRRPAAKAALSESIVAPRGLDGKSRRGTAPDHRQLPTIDSYEVASGAVDSLATPSSSRAEQCSGVKPELDCLEQVKQVVDNGRNKSKCDEQLEDSFSYSEGDSLEELFVLTRKLAAAENVLERLAALHKHRELLHALRGDVF